jgi:hypothetical protein
MKKKSAGMIGIPIKLIAHAFFTAPVTMPIFVQSNWNTKPIARTPTAYHQIVLPRMEKPTADNQYKKEQWTERSVSRSDPNTMARLMAVEIGQKGNTSPRLTKRPHLA